MSASEKIARLRELRDKATGQPWFPVAYDESHCLIDSEDDEWPVAQTVEHRNAAAIVAAMNSLPKLLDAAEALQHLLRHSGIADVDARDKDKQDHDIERKARAALDALAEGGGE